MIGKFEGISYANPKEAQRFTYVGYRWVVFDVDNLAESSSKNPHEKLFGVAIASEGRAGGVILLDRSQSAESRARTLVHELLHVVDFVSLGGRLDEEGVVVLENFIHQFGPEILRSLVSEEARDKVWSEKVLKTKAPKQRKR